VGIYHYLFFLSSDIPRTPFKTKNEVMGVQLCTIYVVQTKELKACTSLFGLFHYCFLTVGLVFAVFVVLSVKIGWSKDTLKG